MSEDELSDESLRAEDLVQRSLFLTDDVGLVRIVVRLCFGEHFIGHFRQALLATTSSSIGCSFSDSIIPNDCRVRVLLRWDESFGDGEGETRRAVAWVTASDAAAFISDFIRSIIDAHVA